MQAHSSDISTVLQHFGTRPSGLAPDEAANRLKDYGENRLPEAKPSGLPEVFFRQFLNPLIYILVAAAAVSLALGEITEAAFIFAVLVINAVIGTVQEYSAEKSAVALRQISVAHAIVQRGGEAYEIPSREVVPGDIVHLESGVKVPADLRLISAQGLEIDESLLTGESLPSVKDHSQLHEESTSLGDRRNLAFAGTLVTRGRATGVTVGTGLNTELGRIAEALVDKIGAKTPLVLRMEQFTHRIAYALLATVAVIGGFYLAQGSGFGQVLTLSVALAVAAVPEGLPVAMTVALAIATSRMSKRNVIVRKLPAVEALGSCTFIATDKTGTLTMNQITAARALLPGGALVEITGTGVTPEGEFIFPRSVDPVTLRTAVDELCTVAVLCNEGFLGRRGEAWTHHGDPVDVALLVMGHKAGLTRASLEASAEPIDTIPFESERKYAATLHHSGGRQIQSVKGAVEVVLPMCASGTDRDAITAEAESLASAGYRVLAFARRIRPAGAPERLRQDDLREMEFVGLVGMIDPLRPEAREAVQLCGEAGIQVAMVTGDHPATALAIARELKLAESAADVVTGRQLAAAPTETERDRLIAPAKVFARVEPQQKLEIVQSLLRQGHFVAVTGDGANDAPALKAANVGVAMGKTGTDVARETSDLILTDDRFASIVAGIEDGRVAYGNVRKVIQLLVATGAAEIFLFILALSTGLPAPLTAVQLLWLNLVANGIQDVALAFEPAEGDELKRQPRPPREAIFDRLMLERVGIAALVGGGCAFWFFRNAMIQGGEITEVRNSVLLLMVFFCNFMVGNARSEKRSLFRLNPLKNPVLFLGTLAAVLIHVGAMYLPGLNEVLGVTPVPLEHAARLFAVAGAVLAAVELHKFVWSVFRPESASIHR